MQNTATNCNCPKKKCERHGDCIACEAYHSYRKQPPYCKRENLVKKLFLKIKKIKHYIK